MEYILLIIGIALIIYSIVGKLKEKDEPNNPNRTDYYNGEDKSFDNVLEQKIILERLDDIENKIDYIYDKYKYIENKKLELDIKNSDIFEDDQHEAEAYAEAKVEEDIINKIIFKLKDEGADIEDIAQKTGMLKGEVLLRLGMRK